MDDDGLNEERAALDAAIRAYARKWAQVHAEDPAVTVQAWVVAAEFTSFELMDNDQYGFVCARPDTQMASASLGLALKAVKHYS